MIPLCESFFCQSPLRYYNIGFDQGYTCPKCGRLYETYDSTGRRRDAEPLKEKTRKVPCWKCKGGGRLRREKLFAPIEVILTLGYITALRILMESDTSDSRFWKQCDICHGKGWQDDS